MKGKYAPINPVALSTDRPAPGSDSYNPDLFGNAPLSVSAVVGNNADLMENIAPLWIKENDFVIDVTFGRGVFWKKLEGLPHRGHDIAKDGVDCRNIPYDDRSVDVVVFDPPYRPSHGSKLDDGNGLKKAYRLNGLDTINDVVELYRDGIQEATRVLKPNGRMLCKCQDMSYGHRLHLVSLDVLRIMIENDIDLADQYILVNNSRLSSSKWKKQERARRSHSILWVGMKCVK